MSEIGQKLIAAVRARAAANPDKVYEPPALGDNGNGCVNVFNGEGSCIVGCGALDSGLITPAFEDSSVNKAGVHSMNKYLRINLGTGMTPQELNWLANVQGEQDRGTAWGRAVELADEHYPLP